MKLNLNLTKIELELKTKLKLNRMITRPHLIFISLNKINSAYKFIATVLLQTLHGKDNPEHKFHLRNRKYEHTHTYMKNIHMYILNYNLHIKTYSFILPKK